MAALQHIEIDFTVTPQMVTAFARLSGDTNSMHVDPEVARKSRYRQPVVHGMIPFSFIQLLAGQFHDRQLEFTRLSVKFRKPVFPGDQINLIITYTDAEYEAVWQNRANGEVLLKSKGAFRLDPYPKADTATASSFLLDTLDEAQLLIDELEGRQAEFHFQTGARLKQQYVSEIYRPGLHGTAAVPTPGDNLVGVLMLSTLVGMRLPGRYATFTRFEIEFASDLHPAQVYRLLGKVTRAKRATEIMEADVQISGESRIAQGKVEVMLNPPPRAMLSSHEIHTKYRYLNLDGKVALITGASRGIGETTAKLLAALGAKVIVNYYRGKGDAERIVSEITGQDGEAMAIQCDITKEASVRQMIQAALEKYGRIDVLVNNAVKDFAPKNITEMDWQDFNQEMEVSVKGMHACCREIIPIFKQNGGGKIINLSTVAVDNPVAGQSRYITAKSAVVGYTKSLAKELLKFNIQANLVIPNMTDTDLVSVLPTMYRDKIADSRPYGRHVQPIEVAQSIAFLASSWSDAITGQKIVLNLGEPPFA